MAAAARPFDLALSEDKLSLLVGALIEALWTRTGTRAGVVNLVVDAPSGPVKARAKPPPPARTLSHCQGLPRRRPLAGLLWKVMRVVPEWETSRTEELPPVFANV